MKIVDDSIAALRFLTRFPVPAPVRPEAGFGARVFPLVGLLLGALALALDAATSFLPERLRDVGILVLWALASGAIHHDGFADVLDALGGATREERLRIMRDETVGVFAALGLVLLVATELAALAEIRGEARSAALLTAPVLARWAIVVAAFRAPTAREEGLGAAFVRALDARQVGVATLVTLVIVGLFAGVRTWLLCPVVAGGAIALRRRAAAAFGGVTGDVLGASAAIAEALALALFAAT